MINIAYAMGKSGWVSQTEGFMSFAPLIIIFVIFYFLLIRPQQKKNKDHQEMVNNLKKGNRVITSGGIHGVITSADENTVTVEIAENVKIKVLRGNISNLNEPVYNQSQQKGIK